MSMEEFEQMDNEVMGLVNDHAAPEAVTRAEQICEDTAIKPAKLTETEGVDDANIKYSINQKQYEELEAVVETERRRKTMAAVIVCALIAVALLTVLARPALLIWLVNIGIVCCSVVAGVALDRRWNR